jgi:hypothetical protein
MAFTIVVDVFDEVTPRREYLLRTTEAQRNERKLITTRFRRADFAVGKRFAIDCEPTGVGREVRVLSAQEVA